jgi:septum formation protein
VGLGEGIGKAGGYAIQGKAALFVEGIQGDYTNVVGLPLALTSRMLEDYGIRWY